MGPSSTAHLPEGVSVGSDDEGDLDPALMQKLYAPATRNSQQTVWRKWTQYCETRSLSPEWELRSFRVTFVVKFFLWWLKNSRIRSQRTLQTYYNNLTTVRQIRTGEYDINMGLKRHLESARQNLGQRFKLRTKKAPKPLARVEDAYKALGVLWSDPELKFRHERERLQLALFILLAVYTGNRPTAILSLRYSDLKVTLFRDPEGTELHNLVIELEFIHTKSYLGPKDANTFPIPSLRDEPSLVLCLQTLLLAVAFQDAAFECVSTPDQLLDGLKVPKRSQELSILIAESKADVMLFRNVHKTSSGFKVSSTKPATSAWLRRQLKRLSRFAGLQQDILPYCFRRGHGEALDQSKDVSNHQLARVLQHKNSDVFLGNYTSNVITADTVAVCRGLKPQVAVLAALTGVMRSADPFRPRVLDDDQSAEVHNRADVLMLRGKKKFLREQIINKYGSMQGSPDGPLRTRYYDLCRQYATCKRTAYEERLRQARSDFDKQQPNIDVRAQLAGETIDDIVGKIGATVEDTKLSEARQSALASLFMPPPSPPDLSMDRKRRINVIVALVRLSQGCEPATPRICRPKRQIEPTLSESRLTVHQNASAAAMRAGFPMVCPATVCLFCLGNVNLEVELRVREFSSIYTMKTHFHNQHLSRCVSTDWPMKCPHPNCDAHVTSGAKLQQHALLMHQVKT